MLGFGFLSVVCLLASSAIAGLSSRAEPFRFRQGSFKIVQFTDPQDGPVFHPKTKAAMERILDAEKPGLVVITGDLVSTGEFQNKDQVRRSLEALAQPMESRRIPWAATFGNHDCDALDRLGITKGDMMAWMRALPHNRNTDDPAGVPGVGNNLLRVLGADGKPAFAVWLLDSHSYAPAEVGGQKLGAYGWIQPEQIGWYARESHALEAEGGRKVPGLMFFHIPLPEFGAMHAAGLAKEGEKNEDECPSLINSGMFGAILARGDVAGVFVGHDHVNTYVGTWYGVRLGYAGNIGFATYGLKGEERDRLRGARVFEVGEKDPRAFRTRYVLASSFGG